MEIRITSRHEKVSQHFQDTITDEINKMERFSDKITSCHVILDSEKVEKSAEIQMHASGREVVATDRAENLGKAFSGALDKIERQLIKNNQKKKNHKHTKAVD